MSVAYPWYEVGSDHKIGPGVLVFPTLYTICAERLLVCSYIDTRLSQIEFDMELPKSILKAGVIQDSLKRLQVWRRVVSQLRQMVTEALEQGLPAATRLATNGSDLDGEAFDNIRADYERVLRLVQELQGRVSGLSDTINAEISNQMATQGLDENHSLARLSWLATIFVPAIFIIGLFSMTDDLAAFQITIKRYFRIALPVTIAIIR